MSEWTIGKVVLPKAPSRITNKFPKIIKKINVLTNAPWLFSQGGDTFQLTLDGSIFEGSKSLPTIRASYITPIRNYIKQPMVIPEVIMDEDISDWKTSGVYFFNSNSQNVVFGDYSIGARFQNSSANIMRYFEDARDFSLHNFTSLWSRGVSTDKFKISFYNTSGDRSKGYRTYISMSNYIWTQKFSSISSAEYANYIEGEIGTPTGWDSIEAIEIKPSGFDPSGTRYLFDRWAMGTGFKVDTPDQSYDGIYMIKDFLTTEAGGDIVSYKYKLTLLDTGDYYGEQ